MLVRHEGLRLKTYVDTVGKVSVGVGRNLTDKGIRESEAYFMLDNDIAEAIDEAKKLTCFAKLDPVRQDVIVDMTFNLGLPRLKGFGLMLKALEAGDFQEAAAQMMDSRWAVQVGPRAKELAQMIRSGKYAT